MREYVVVIGSFTLNTRKMVFCNSIEECQEAVKKHTRSIRDICDFGYDDEGDVYLLEDSIMELIGYVTFDGSFCNTEELIIASES